MRRLAATAIPKARDRGARAKLRAAARLDELADRCQKVATQIRQRVRGEKITDRLVSLSNADTDADEPNVALGVTDPRHDRVAVYQMDHIGLRRQLGLRCSRHPNVMAIAASTSATRFRPRAVKR